MSLKFHLIYIKRERKGQYIFIVKVQHRWVSDSNVVSLHFTKLKNLKANENGRTFLLLSTRFTLDAAGTQRNVFLKL